MCHFITSPPDCHITGGKSSITVIREQISSPAITAAVRGLLHLCKWKRRLIHWHSLMDSSWKKRQQPLDPGWRKHITTLSTLSPLLLLHLLCFFTVLPTTPPFPSLPLLCPPPSVIFAPTPAPFQLFLQFYIPQPPCPPCPPPHVSEAKFLSDADS